MPQDKDRWQDKAEVIDCFDSSFISLSLGATGPGVDQTFLSAVRSSHPLAARFVTNVINGKTALDAEFERGRGLCIAVQRARFEVVDYLLAQRPVESTLRYGFMAIFECGCEEQILTKLAESSLAIQKERMIYICNTTSWRIVHYINRYIVKVTNQASCRPY